MSGSATKLLIIEDDGIVRQFLRMALAKQHYEISEAATGGDGLTKAAEITPDLILLDLNLPDMDGLEVAIRLREWMQAPIIVLSSREQEEVKVSALDAGADDYITKPIGVAELQARLRVALRHTRRPAETPEQSVFEINGLKIDALKRQVHLNQGEVRLTPTEYKLLLYLVKNAGRVIKHQELLKAVWGPQYEDEVNYLRIYIKHLRGKIEADPANPIFIRNEPRVGYRFTEHSPT